MAAKAMPSKLPGRPNSRGSQSLSWSRSTVTTPAPSTAPQSEPAPPRMTMNRYSMPAVRLNGVGLTRCWRWA